MKSQPYYFSFFTQADSPHFDINWMKSFDMSWIDDLNAEQKNEFEEDKKDMDLSESYHSSDDGTNSKDFDSVDFPLSHHWPEDFKNKFHQSVKDSDEKISALIKEADEVVKIKEMTIYLDCPDGHHYFSTPHFARGDIQQAGIDGDSKYDSAETAVYVFINQWNEWNKKHGETYKKACKLSELEALRTPEQTNEDSSECQHDDLGSLGYIHGETVICPFCGKNAVVW